MRDKRRAAGFVVAASLLLAHALATAQPQPFDAAVDASVDASNGNVAVDGAVEPEEPPTPDEERAAARVIPDEPADPIAEEAERTGPPEGAPLPGHPTLATEIAALSDRACYRALTRARVSFERVRHTVPGVVTPVVVTGPFRGVTVRDHSAPVIHEMMDCRLAVSIARYARLLRAMGVREVRHISLFRAATPREVARVPIQTRHPGAMAIDIASYHFDSGQVLVVERDFHGRRGRPMCGPTAHVPTQTQARTLRTLACEAARRGYFHVVLGPNFNREHRNHFHLEVTRSVAWQFVR